MPWGEIDERKKKERITAGDVIMNERHRMFDLQAQDNTAKSERPQFAVVGEGSKQSQEAYREGWERIFGGTEGRSASKLTEAKT